MSNAKRFNFTTLDYQEKAIDSVIKVFTGIKFNDADNGLSNPTFDKDVNCTTIIENIKNIREDNKIKLGTEQLTENNDITIDVLMETGTGKTFTFLETIYKLNEKYNLAKFIILVSSNAIEQGTIKNIDITSEYFEQKYNKNITIENSYDAFIRNSTDRITVLIKNTQSFNKDNNIINKNTLEASFLFNDRVTSYMQAIANINPIIIIDEPHRFKGTKTQEYLPEFNAQFIIRYGATFKDDYQNLVYTLDSIDAFRMKLVKSITVQTVTADKGEQHSITYKKCEKDDDNKKVASIEYKDLNNKSHTIQIKEKDNLGTKTKISELDDYIVEKITTKEIIFTNGYNLLFNAENSYGVILNSIRKVMLRNTIENHFEKEQKLFKKGIKALSLIFINERQKYLKDDGSNGELAQLFESLYSEILNNKLQDKRISSDYRAYLERTKENISKVHGGYFAVSNTIQDDKIASDIDKILKDKEKLLSQEDDLRFIFSMWALQEGWDNPNIFTLCKLAPTNSKITKLQQIGRGLRLAVRTHYNKFERITYDKNQNEFNDINELTVIVGESEKNFVQEIQQEIIEHNINNVLNEIDDKILIEKGVCKNTSIANKIIGILSDFKVVEADINAGIAKIIDTKQLSEAIDACKNIKLDFDADNLTKLIESRIDIGNFINEKRNFNNEKIKINKENYKKFEQLWKDINRKTIYTYKINEAKLIQEIVKNINDNLDVKQATITTSIQRNVENKQNTKKTSKSETIETPISQYSIKEFTQEIVNKTSLPHITILQILKQIDKTKFQTITHDENYAITKISDYARDAINTHIQQNLSYNINETKCGNEKTELTDDEGKVLDEIIMKSFYRYDITNETIKEKSVTKFVIPYDSQIEKDTIENSTDDKITVFAKIPYIKIPTPHGEYNPDFAYVLQKDEHTSVHLIVETKGFDDLKDTKVKEQNKISSARKFFEQLNEKVKGTGIQIFYETRTNRESLATIIENTIKK